MVTTEDVVRVADSVPGQLPVELFRSECGFIVPLVQIDRFHGSEILLVGGDRRKGTNVGYYQRKRLETFICFPIRLI